MEEEKLYGVGFCKVGSVFQYYKYTMKDAQYKLNQTEILLRRELKKNVTLTRKLKEEKEKNKKKKIIK